MKFNLEGKKYHGLLFVCVLALALLIANSQWVQIWDKQLFDRQMQLKRYLLPVSELREQVVLVGIDEQTYASFREPFALWHRHLADFFQALAISDIRVLGIDISLPDRSFNSVIAGIDQHLLRGLLLLKKKAPVVLGITVDQNGRQRRIYPPYLSVVGKQGRGLVLWEKDADRVVRRYRHHYFESSQRILTLVGQMAEHLQLTPPATGLIDYSRGALIQYIPMQTVIQWYEQKNFQQLRDVFAKTAVILGTVLPFEDRHYQPLNLLAWERDNNHLVPGVTIHVQALRNLLDRGLLQTVDFRYILFLNLTAVLFFWLRPGFLRALGLFLFLTLCLLIVQWLLLQQQLYLPVLSTILALGLAIFSRWLLETAFHALERQRLRQAFGGYVSPDILEEILKGEIKPGVHGERHRICVLFSDIRSFTSISEKMSPEQVIQFLNIYLAAMAEAIQDNGGVVDKFIGDGIMAFFGAPKKLQQPALHAFDAARAKLKNLQAVNEQIKDMQMPRLQIGIGLHIGDAVVGNIGSEKRNEYTAIGDVVNTASRLEGLTKQAGYPVVASLEFVQDLPADLQSQFDDLGKMSVKGREAVAVYGWPSKKGSH